MNQKGGKKKGKEQQHGRCRLESRGAFGIIRNIRQTSAAFSMPKLIFLPTAVCVTLWMYNARESQCLYLFQFSMQTSPLNAFHTLSHSALLPGAGGHTSTWALGKGERVEGKVLPNLALFLCVSQVEKDISMSCSLHALFAFPFPCLFLWMNQVQILS